MSKILCSTGALLEYGGDYRLLEPLSRQLYIPVVHCEKSIGENLSKGGAAQLADAYEKFEINCNPFR